MSLPSHHSGLPPGELIGPYRIVRRLGAGGMGTVHEAVDTALRRNVALKVITGELADDPGFRARFVREAQVQASLDSPHVVQVFAHGQVDGRLYIASQLVPDGDLGTLLRSQGPPPVAVGVDLVAQVADGLAEAHRSGLVHGDIKPANVLLRNRGTDTVAYLADFGIARPIGSANGAAGVAGTPSYMAPELHAGGAAGPMGDVYALGCLLWATLTGRAPAVGAPIPQLAGRSRLEREVDRVLRATLAPDPRDRPGSAAAVRDDLRSLARTPPAGRRGPLALAAATAAGLAAVTVLVTVLVTAPRGPTDPGREETAIANIARALADHGGLGAREAECTARRLVDEHGVDGLRDEGVLDDELDVLDGDGTVKPRVLAGAFRSTFSCVWSPAAPVSGP